MTKSEKKIVLNGIIIFSRELREDLLPKLHEHCKWGLQKGKPSSIDWTIERLRQLADELEKYNEDDFNLSDMVDYKG